MASRSIRGILGWGNLQYPVRRSGTVSILWERSKGAFFMWRFHLNVDTANTKLGVKSCDHVCFNGWFVHCVIMN